jgi:hypothetical protein
MAIAASGADPAPLVPSATVGGTRRAKRRALPVNIAALVLVLGGAVLQLIALVDSIWLDSPTGRLGFTGLKLWAQPGYVAAYTSWIAWLLVGATTVFGVLACIRWSGASIFRYLGAVIGVAGAFMTVGAILLLAYQTDDNSFHVARNYAVGVYLVVLGLLASALGAAAGTGRRG